MVSIFEKVFYYGTWWMVCSRHLATYLLGRQVVRVLTLVDEPEPIAAY